MDSPYPGPLPPLHPPTQPQAPPPRPRRRAPRWLVGAVLPAAIGAGVAVGSLAATDNLGGGGTSTTIVRQVSVAAQPAASGGDAATVPAVRTAGGLSVQDVVRRTSPAIVLVRATTSQGEALGSGFLIDDQGHILTNDHVVDSAGQVQVTFSDRTTSTARVLGTDPSTDLAVLQVSDVPASAHPVALGRSGSLTVGDDVVALGNPLGLERTATTGIVSALKREITSPNGFPIQNVVQTDAAINHGNSGGPLLDLQGRVIGINSQIASESGGSDGIGFAVPIDTVRPVAESIIETGKAQHAWMGITGRDLDPQLAEKVGLPGQTGVLIDKADPRGPAARAGIEGASNPDAAVPRGGDLVVAIDGHAVTDMADVSQQVASRRVGDSVSVTVLRDGKRMNLEMTLADRPSDVGIR